MVLESLINVKAARENHYWVFLVSAFITATSTFVASLLFPESPGIFSVVLTTFSLLPFMVKLMHIQAKKEEELEILRKKGFLYAHREVLCIYISLFLGEVFAWLILYFFLPQQIVEKIFKDQITEIHRIRGYLTALENYEKIVLNNLCVLSLCILFSFIYGCGAIFILSWNASVLSAFIGMNAVSIYNVPKIIVGIFPYASLEILAYFLGGIAGGMISAEISRPNKSKWLTYVFWDATSLIAIAILLIFIAGAIETTALYLK